MHFPRMLHKPDDRLVVNTQDDFDAALADGWVVSRADLNKPAPIVTPVAPTPKRPPGRPKKTEGT